MPWSGGSTDYSIHQVLHTPPNLLPFNGHAANTSTISIDYGLPVHLPTHTITPSKLAQSQPPGAASHLLKYHLLVYLCIHSISTSTGMAKLAWLGPSSSHNHEPQVNPKTRLNMASQCISEFTWSSPWHATPNSLNDGLPVHHWVNFISASKCIPKLARSWPTCTSLCSSPHSVVKWLS